MLNNKSILVTGGTGSFGKRFVKRVLHTYPDVKKIIIFSRDELKQFDMAQEYPVNIEDRIRFFIGDVRDQNRLLRAMEGVDVVIHAAALKQVPACEYNPFEAIKTNILGAQNVIEAAIERGVTKVVALSTDKAAAPINLYGATKLCSDKLFVAANNYKGSHGIKFSVVRYGNVMGSRGSVFPFFASRARTGQPLPITDKRMTRFNITLDQGVSFVLLALEKMWGGELFVPRLPSYRIMDVAEAIDPSGAREMVGIRPGEKIHEEMITASDAQRTVEFGDYFVIMPSTPVWNDLEFITANSGKFCQEEFSYSSNHNKDWLSIEGIKELIRLHLDFSLMP